MPAFLAPYGVATPWALWLLPLALLPLVASGRRRGPCPPSRRHRATPSPAGSACR